MAETSTKNEMIYEDPVIHDDLFGSVVRGLFWGGFGIMVVARAVMGILYLTFYFDLKSRVTGGSQAAAAAWPGSIDALMVFSLIDTIGTLVFSAGLVVAALVVSRMPQWARITMIGVSALVLVGSNALAAFNLGNLLNLAN